MKNSDLKDQGFNWMKTYGKKMFDAITADPDIIHRPLSGEMKNLMCNIKDAYEYIREEEENTRTEPKEQDEVPVDNIREAFEKTDHYKSAVTKHQVSDRYMLFKSGYKSQQAEIERLKKTADNFRKSLNAEIKVKYDEIHKYIKEADKLKAENEAMRCCGNCGNEEFDFSFHFECKFQDKCKLYLENQKESYWIKGE